MTKSSKTNERPDGMIVRESDPLNLEMPFGEATRFITPNDRFYVRCHYPVPEIKAADWRLEISGTVENPFSLDLDEIRALPARTIVSLLECAGNNRALLDWKTKGVQWAQGAVGNAQWRGTPLSELLAKARPKAGACEVILEGADAGPLDKEGAPPGEVTFSRSLPLSKALDDVLLVYEMNGEPLTAEHGYPLRAIVPGWYAMASVKWLRRIIVTDQPFDGYYQTLDYAYWDRQQGPPTRVALSEMAVKAQIATPRDGETIPARTSVHIKGAAWSSTRIERVELSTDGGKTWNAATCTGPAEPNAWQLWEFAWTTPDQAGECELMARAFDEKGNSQPPQHDKDRGNYMINRTVPVRVKIR